MEAAIGKYAKTIAVPVLWVFAENDRYFGPRHVKSWFAEFQKAGGKGRLVMQPAFGKEGHHLFTSKEGLALWTPAFDAFMEELGIGSKGVTSRAAAAAP